MAKIKKLLVLYPGRFQPFGKQHAATYLGLQQQFPGADIFIVTSDVTNEKSPFNFNEKKAIISAYGLASKVKKVKNPYQALEVVSKYDPKTTALVFAVGKKDAERLSHGTYFKPYPGSIDKLNSLDKNGYVYIAPHISLNVPGYGEMSGTQIRTALGDPTKTKTQKKKLFNDIFGWYSDKLADIIFNKLTMKEGHLPGGKGEKLNPADVDPRELEMGMKHELEHTSDPNIAKEIALDHLAEDPHYYSRLKKAGIDEYKLFSPAWWGDLLVEKACWNRSREYHLDHKISKDYGYKNNIHPSVIGHYKNLEVVHHSVNESKNVQNSIDLETLIIDINNSKNPLDTRILLTCGGAAGHMAHPYDLPQVKTGKDLTKLFVDSVKSLQANPAAVKIDGINTTLKIVKKNGKTQFALDRGSMNPIDVAGITVDDLGSRFGEGHGMLTIGKKVLDAFNACLPKITSELSALGMLKDPTILLNVETVIGDTSGKTNVIAYKENFFVIHGLLKSEQVSPKRRAQKEITGSSSKIQSLVDKCKPIMKKEGYGIYGMIPTEVKEKINFNEPMSTTMTVKYNDEKKVTKTLKEWLSIAKNPGATKIKYNDGRTDTAMTKKNYLAILNQTANLDDMTSDPKAQKMLIDGAVMYHATRLLGNTIIKGLGSEIGNVAEHEGIVIRDPKISNIPFKIVGEFIVTGLQSGFGK